MQNGGRRNVQLGRACAVRYSEYMQLEAPRCQHSRSWTCAGLVVSNRAEPYRMGRRARSKSGKMKIYTNECMMLLETATGAQYIRI